MVTLEESVDINVSKMAIPSTREELGTLLNSEDDNGHLVSGQIVTEEPGRSGPQGGVNRHVGSGDRHGDELDDPDDDDVMEV